MVVFVSCLACLHWCWFKILNFCANGKSFSSSLVAFSHLNLSTDGILSQWCEGEHDGESTWWLTDYYISLHKTPLTLEMCWYLHVLLHCMNQRGLGFRILFLIYFDMLSCCCMYLCTGTYAGFAAKQWFVYILEKEERYCCSRWCTSETPDQSSVLSLNYNYDLLHKTYFFFFSFYNQYLL